MASKPKISTSIPVYGKYWQTMPNFYSKNFLRCWAEWAILAPISKRRARMCLNITACVFYLTIFIELLFFQWTSAFMKQAQPSHKQWRNESEHSLMMIVSCVHNPLISHRMFFSPAIALKQLSRSPDVLKTVESPLGKQPWLSTHISWTTMLDLVNIDTSMLLHPFPPSLQVFIILSPQNILTMRIQHPRISSSSFPMLPSMVSGRIFILIAGWKRTWSATPLRRWSSLRRVSTRVSSPAIGKLISTSRIKGIHH